MNRKPDQYSERERVIIAKLAKCSGRTSITVARRLNPAGHVVVLGGPAAVALQAGEDDTPDRSSYVDPDAKRIRRTSTD
jgi:hypothetical protein